MLPFVLIVYISDQFVLNFFCHFKSFRGLDRLASCESEVILISRYVILRLLFLFSCYALIKKKKHRIQLSSVLVLLARIKL